MSIEKYEELHKMLTDFEPLLESCKDDRERVLSCVGMLMMQVRLMEDFKDLLDNEELKAKMDIIMSAVTETGGKIISILAPETDGDNDESR